MTRQIDQTSRELTNNEMKVQGYGDDIVIIHNGK